MYKEKPRLDTITLSDDELISLYNNIPHGASSGIFYNDGMDHDGMRTSERAIVLECARRFVDRLLSQKK